MDVTENGASSLATTPSTISFKIVKGPLPNSVTILPQTTSMANLATSAITNGTYAMISTSEDETSTSFSRKSVAKSPNAAVDDSSNDAPSVEVASSEVKPNGPKKKKPACTIRREVRMEILKHAMAWVKLHRNTGKLSSFNDMSDAALVMDITGLKKTSVYRANPVRKPHKPDKRQHKPAPEGPRYRKVTPELLAVVENFYKTSLKKGVQPRVIDVQDEVRRQLPHATLVSDTTIGVMLKKLGFTRVVSQVRRLPSSRKKRKTDKKVTGGSKSSV